MRRKIVTWDRKKVVGLISLHAALVLEAHTFVVFQRLGLKEHRWQYTTQRLSQELGEFHIYMKRKQHQRSVDPLVRHVYVCKQDVGEWKASHEGRISSAPLSLSSFAHPLCRRRNRRLWPRTWQEVCLLHNRTFKPRLNCTVRQASDQSCGAAVASFQYYQGMPGLENASEIILGC